MLSEKVIALLNRQINAELHAAQVYLQMGAWCEQQGIPGAAAFFMSHVHEETAHRDVFVQYMFDCDVPVRLTGGEEPRSEFNDLLEVIKAAYEHELGVTAMINEIAAEALKVNDFNTFNFIQKFIAEQREEEALFRGIIDQAQLMNFDGEPGDTMRHMNLYLEGLASAAGA